MTVFEGIRPLLEVADVKIAFHDGEVDEEHPSRSLLTGSLYVNVDDVDALAVELAGKVELHFGPTDQPHGMRPIGLSDLDGYALVFGQPIA